MKGIVEIYKSSFKNWLIFCDHNVHNFQILSILKWHNSTKTENEE